MTEKQYKAAVVQAAPVYLDLQASVDKAGQLIAEAAGNGASLIAFGEAWLPGYPFWAWLDGVFANMEKFAQYQACSMDLNSNEARDVCRAAADNNIFVVMGYSEYDRGSLYLSQAIIDDQGELLANRRKLKPTMIERVVYGEGDGSDLSVHDTRLGRIGGLCCWEHLQPLSRYAMYSQYEQVHVAAWPSFAADPNLAYAMGREVNSSASQLYAAEGQCFVLAPTSVVDDRTLEMMANKQGSSEPFRKGGGYSMIYAPDGRPLTEPLAEDEEGILYADIDLALIDLAKLAADPTGHYSRPDVTRLLFNHRAVPCVENSGGRTTDVTDEAGDENHAGEEQLSGQPRIIS